MATYSTGQALFGLSVTGTPATTSTNVTGNVTLGTSPTVADVASAVGGYSMKFLATTTNATATFTLHTGPLVTTYSGMTVYDGDQRDFEGNTFAITATTLGCLFTIVCATTPSMFNGTVAVPLPKAGKAQFYPYPYLAGTHVVTLGATGDYITIDVVAQ